MKQILLTIFISILVINIHAQNTSRTEVTGKIIASDDVEGVTVFNTSSNKGTIADANGDFKIEVAYNDILEISALQYRAIRVTITKDVITSKKLRLFLVEELNQLNEIILLPTTLTGELKVDIDNSDERRVVIMDFGNAGEMEFGVDQFTKVDNQLMRQGEFYNGVNFATILGLNKLLNSPIKKQSLKQLRANEKQDLADKYEPTYFNSNFNIPLDRVEAFISFVNTNGFDESLLQTRNEVKLIEFLNKQSVLFLKQENEKK